MFKIKNMTKQVTLAVLILLLLQSCTTAIIDEGDPSSLPPITRTITYESDVASIMTNNCITCHAGPSPNAGLDLSNYQNTRFSTEMGNLIQRMNNAANPMPPNGLVSPELRLIMDKWVTDGFLEN